jgi:thiol-disulfide isomerase/thioredoxin
MKLISLVILLFISNSLLAEPYKAGDVPFDVVGKTSDGTEVKVSDYKGKVVIVSFWASWCPPCRKELPVLSGIQKSATAQHLQVLSVNIDEDPKLFRKLKEALALGDMILVSDAKHRVKRKYGVEGIPHMVIIDAEGKVASVHVGYGESSLPGLIDEINAVARRQPAS